MANYGDLFREYHRQARKAAREEFARTPVGRLMRLGSGYKPAKEADVKRFLAAVRVQQFGLTPSLKGIRFRAVSYSIERYAKEDSPQGDLVRAWLESLGEAGQFLLEMFGSPTAPVRGMRGVADALESAMRLLRVFGYEVLPNPNRPMTPAAHARAVAAAWRFLRDTGELQAAEVFGDIRGLSRLTEDVFQRAVCVVNFLAGE
ncbi:hypothetical protein [Thermopirellula anaerolimosa]